MNLAVFADLHGKLVLCFQLCARWQQETGEPIHYILQAGDLGTFPDLTRVDRATRRHAEHDPAELAFAHHFVAPDPAVAAVLDETTCPLIFVRGNHEDHAWLDGLERATPDPIFSVDAYQRVYCLKTGIPYPLTDGSSTCTLLGIGRIGPRGADPDRYQAQYIQPYELERLYDRHPQPCDILLTHDSALDFVTPGYGMEEIRLILDSARPVYHVYGHAGQPATIQPDANQQTVSIKLHDLSWDRRTQRTIPDGVMGILRWQGPADHTFQVVDAPWLLEYSAGVWTRRRR